MLNGKLTDFGALNVRFWLWLNYDVLIHAKCIAGKTPKQVLAMCPVAGVTVENIIKAASGNN